MNRADRKIAERIARGGSLPTAYDPWHDADREISETLTTNPSDYTKKGGMVIFEYGEGNQR